MWVRARACVCMYLGLANAFFGWLHWSGSITALKLYKTVVLNPFLPIVINMHHHLHSYLLCNRPIIRVHWSDFLSHSEVSQFANTTSKEATPHKIQLHVQDVHRPAKQRKKFNDPLKKALHLQEYRPKSEWNTSFS